VNLVGGGAAVAVASAVWLAQSASGADLGGIAAVIAATAGLISAVGAIIIGLRSKSNTNTDEERAILLELLKDQLNKKRRKGDER
jgi:hypothetical protein